LHNPRILHAFSLMSPLKPVKNHLGVF
jgi:hypothetical protein